MVRRYSLGVIKGKGNKRDVGLIVFSDTGEPDAFSIVVDEDEGV